jgi:hypothetical protein
MTKACSAALFVPGLRRRLIIIRMSRPCGPVWLPLWTSTVQDFLVVSRIQFSNSLAMVLSALRDGNE